MNVEKLEGGEGKKKKKKYMQFDPPFFRKIANRTISFTKIVIKNFAR